MRTIWTICRRELYSYFVSPIAWVLLAMFEKIGAITCSFTLMGPPPPVICDSMDILTK